MPKSEQEAWLFKLRLGITVAGGVVVDEVVEAWDGGDIYDRQKDRTVEYARGDKFYIERAKTRDGED